MIATQSGIWMMAALLAAGAAIFGADRGFSVHMAIAAVAAIIAAFATMKQVGEHAPTAVPPDRYDDDVIRWGVIATTVWGVVGFAAGLFIALQLTFPWLNFPTEYTTFGRLRPLHTSAVIFAFGGNALLMSSLYIVQRTCRARLFAPGLARFVFWGYQLFIVLAATGYLMGVTESREYAEPEWYVDIWLTIVWVSYLIVFGGTILKRSEPHIYVANWFFLAFIITVAMLHLVNNLAVPVSFLGSKSYSAFAGVQDCLLYTSPSPRDGLLSRMPSSA